MPDPSPAEQLEGALVLVGELRSVIGVLQTDNDMLRDKLDFRI